MLFATIPSCGAAPIDRHAAYGRIQVEEARIARASHALAEGDADPAHCDALCDASRAIDAEATLLGEADARTRAERAAQSCAACGAGR